MDGFEHVADPPIEAFQYSVGLGMKSRCEPVFDDVFLARLVEQVLSKRSSEAMSKAIGEACYVVGQRVEYGKFEKIDAMPQERHGLFDTRFGTYCFSMKGYLHKYSSRALPLDELILKVRPLPEAGFGNKIV